jgi:hypothetical protein
MREAVPFLDNACNGSWIRWKASIIERGNCTKNIEGRPRQATDWKNSKQTDEPWKGPVEKEQKPGGPPPDLEKWHETNTH